MKHTKHFLLWLLFVSTLLCSCEKFLDAKSDKKLVVPSSLADLQAMLDLNATINRNGSTLGEGSADNYYITYADFASLNESEKNIYTWGDEVIFNRYPNEWTYTYIPVNYANTVLDNLQKLPVAERESGEGKLVKGHALFIRAKNFLTAAFTWAKAYDAATAGSDLGIPLRLGSDFNEPSERASVAQTYQQVIDDLQEAVQLLPATPLHVMRPSKAAAYALLARTYLAMRIYDKALVAAGASLAIQNDLLDYNTVNTAAAFPFVRFNSETIFFSLATPGANLGQVRAKIDSSLYISYATNDLRKQAFFRANGNGSYSFKGSYDGTNSFFNGITTAEMYLTRAESRARTGDVTGAMADLNTLLVKRWKAGTFTNLAASSPQQAITFIVTERRKELLFRDLRWIDIKRLNKEGMNITVKRNLNSQLIELPPNDNRYALPMPAVVIQHAGMQQNPR